MSAGSGRARAVEFTVHNLEHRTTNYHYTLSVVSANGHTEQAMDSGSFALNYGSSLNTSKHVTLPRVEGRVTIKVSLEYEGIALGDHTPTTQIQAIHHWTTVRQQRP